MSETHVAQPWVRSPVRSDNPERGGPNCPAEHDELGPPWGVEKFILTGLDVLPLCLVLEKQCKLQNAKCKSQNDRAHCPIRQAAASFQHILHFALSTLHFALSSSPPYRHARSATKNTTMAKPQTACQLQVFKPAGPPRWGYRY